MRFTQYMQKAAPGLGLAFVKHDAPYNEKLGLHLHIWRWHAHFYWNEA